jgi:hypothetical protein
MLEKVQSQTTFGSWNTKMPILKTKTTHRVSANPAACQALKIKLKTNHIKVLLWYLFCLLHIKQLTMAIAQACHTKSKCNLQKTRGGKMPTKYLFESLTTHPSVILCMRLSKKESMTEYYGCCYSYLRPAGE